MIRGVFAFIALAFATAAAVAASADVATRPDDPALATTALPRTTGFETYRPFRDEPRADWRALNDEVGRMGGHTGHTEDDTPQPGGDGGAASGGHQHGH